MKYNKVLRFISKEILFFLTLLIVIVMSLLKENFFTIENAIGVLLVVSVEGMILYGMTFTMILGDIDLSVGAIMSLTCVITIFLQRFGTVVAIVGGMVTGLVIGIANGYFIGYKKAASMPITLGMMVFINGLVLTLTNSKSISGETDIFPKIANTAIFGIPSVIYILIITAFIFHMILSRTQFGRNLYAIGGNIHAAEQAGINVKKSKMLTFVISGFLAGLSGVLLVSRYNVGSVLTGQQTATFIITIALMGGVSLKGGEGTILNAFKGMIFVAILGNTMMFLGFQGSVQKIIMGGFLLTILIIDAIKTNRRKFE